MKKNKWLLLLAMFFMNSAFGFAATLPVQEKVYIHTDNDWYQAGDTVRYMSYLLRSDNMRKSDISRVLYVELLSPEGYVLNRQTVDVNRGEGKFALDRKTKSGCYEIRAYTKWMLNFGARQRNVATSVKNQFINKAAAQDFFTDYDKLYSKVIIVSDRIPGSAKTRNGSHQSAPVMTFYPEGGKMIAGKTCRVAFLATDGEGREIDLKGNVTDGRGKILTTFTTLSRGRGAFRLPCDGSTYKAVAEYGGKRYAWLLPKAEKKGCAICLEDNGSTISATLLPLGIPSPGASVICGDQITALNVVQKDNGRYEVTIPLRQLRLGVARLMVYDGNKNVCASRNFFVRNSGQEPGRIKIDCTEEDGNLYRLHIKTQPNATLSVSVDDSAINPGSNMNTEMLLCSEVKDFIHQPGYYLEKDDSIHRQALDLLMMTQAWSRYDDNLALGNTDFRPRYGAETGLSLTGSVYGLVRGQDRITAEDQKNGDMHWLAHDSDVKMDGKNPEAERNALNVIFSGDRSRFYPAHGKSSNLFDALKLKKRDTAIPVSVHSKFVTVNPLQAEPSEMGVSENGGRFKISIPDFSGCRMALVYAGTEKSDSLLLNSDERSLADYYVKFDNFYPHTAKPYSYYQTHVDGVDMAGDADSASIVVDGGWLFNTLADCGLNPAFFSFRNTVNQACAYFTGRNADDVNASISVDCEGRFINIADAYLNRVRSIRINTDYLPRRNNQPKSFKMSYELFPSGMMRKTIKDRLIQVCGYSDNANMDTSDNAGMKTMNGSSNTLYWNPKVTTNADGEATVEFYCHSTNGRLSIAAEGMSGNGTPIVYDGQ